MMAMKLWASFLCRLRKMVGELGLVEQKVLPIKVEEHRQSCTKLGLKEGGSLQKHVETWKEGKSSVLHVG